MNLHPLDIGIFLVFIVKEVVMGRPPTGWPSYFMPMLVRAGQLKPLWKPDQNARKWYATVEREWLGCDPVCLDTTIHIVDRLVCEANGKIKGKGFEAPLAV